MTFFVQIQFAQIKHISSKEAAAGRANVIYHNTCLLEVCLKKNNNEIMQHYIIQQYEWHTSKS